MNALLRFAIFVALAGSALAATTEPTVKKEDLPRVLPTEIAGVMKTFKVRPGFHLELVAGEPDVVDPIAMCFDENGRMFVIEMRDYSERREEKLGRIRMLEDIDGDGKYEKSTIFLKDLAWPTALFWCNGGLLVGASPDILFARDTDGDGVADETKVLFTGFGNEPRLNVQGLFNNFNWGLDNRIHGCSGLNGGKVKQLMHPDAPPLDVRGKGFVINPRDWSMTTEAGGGQYGLSFDHTGRMFTCQNSSHCEVIMYDPRYAARNPYVTLPDPRINIAADGPAAEVYRISPEEPWRVIRTRWRIAGLVKGQIEGGGRSAGYFTGATGVTVYRGDAFGPDYVGDAFIGDAGGNLVHHKRIRQGKDGIEPIAARPDDEKKIEFVASTDNWFRPVDFANTPDGTLFIADMYRETIEHPWSIPPQIKQFLDLNSGNDRGRIYRIAPDGFKRRPPPKLASATTAELVATLGHPSGWHRDTAARLLFQRQDRAAVPLLTELIERAPSPLGRMHALFALDGLGGLDVAHVMVGMDDGDPSVRAHAIKLSERFRDKQPSPQLWMAYVARATDKDARVRYQLAFTLGEVAHHNRANLLREIARTDIASPWTRAAILSSCGGARAETFEAFARDSVICTSGDGKKFLGQVALSVARSGYRGDREQVARFAAATRDLALKFTVARGLADGMQRAGIPVSEAEHFVTCVNEAALCAGDPKAKPGDRLLAIALISYCEYEQAKAVLLPLLSGSSGQSAALAGVATLDQFDERELAKDVLMNWSTMSLRVKSDALSMLIKRPQRAAAVLDAIEKKTIAPKEIDAAQAELLRRHSDPEIRRRASQLLPPPPSRDSVIAGFLPSLDLTGDAARGRIVYQQRCISCHRAGGEGSLIGPDFTTLKTTGREKLLFNILDPNREVQPQYVSYLIETKDGQDVLGMLATDTPAAVLIRQAYARETTVQRSNIKRMTSQGKSLMPEGLEVGMSPQDMADLIAFIEKQ